MQGLPWAVADDVHMQGLGHTVPDVEPHRGTPPVAPRASGQTHGVGVPLRHGFWQTQEEPVVQFAAEVVVGVHGFRLAPDRRRTLPPILSVVVARNAPSRGCLCTVGAQPLTEGEQRVVALHKVVAQIGAAPRPVVAVAHLAVAQVQHKCTFVDDV